MELPLLSRMLNAKASGVPPASTLVVKSSTNDKLAPGVKVSTRALKALLVLRDTLLPISPLAPPKIQGAKTAGQPELALPPAPYKKSLIVTVLLSDCEP